MSITAVMTPGGKAVSFTTRDGTNDATMAAALNVWEGVVNDEYQMTGRTLSGWALDVGAHIGTLTIPLALDHPELRVIAVEGVPQNAALITENAERNGVADRVTVLNAYAAAPGTVKGICSYGYQHVTDVGNDYVTAHRFIGGTWDLTGEGDPEFSDEIDAVSLDDLLTRFRIDDLALLKIDCEGCEWMFLDTKAVAKVETIVGEYHGRPLGADPVKRLDELLGATHEVTIWGDQAFDAGLFQAVRR